MSRYAMRRRIGVTLLTALLACNERTGPVEPTLVASDAVLQLARSDKTTRAQAIKRSRALKHDIVATAKITPAGGMLRIDEAGLILYFPPGAVSRDLVVTARAEHGRRVAYDFQPHGTTFNVPVVVAQEMTLTEYVRPEGELTPNIQGGYLARGMSDVDNTDTATMAEAFPVLYRDRGQGTYLVFATTHFSGYLFTSGRCESRGEIPFDLP